MQREDYYNYSLVMFIIGSVLDFLLFGKYAPGFATIVFLGLFAFFVLPVILDKRGAARVRKAAEESDELKKLLEKVELAAKAKAEAVSIRASIRNLFQAKRHYHAIIDLTFSFVNPPVARTCLEAAQKVQAHDELKHAEMREMCRAQPENMARFIHHYLEETKAFKAQTDKWVTGLLFDAPYETVNRYMVPLLDSDAEVDETSMTLPSGIFIQNLCGEACWGQNQAGIFLEVAREKIKALYPHIRLDFDTTPPQNEAPRL